MIGAKIPRPWLKPCWLWVWQLDRNSYQTDIGAWWWCGVGRTPKGTNFTWRESK